MYYYYFISHVIIYIIVVVVDDDINIYFSYSTSCGGNEFRD